MREYAIGIDIGGTKIAAGLVDRLGEIKFKKVVPTPKESHTAILQCITELVDTLTAIAKKEAYLLIGIGIGSAGQIDYQKGEILSGTSNIKDWSRIQMTNHLKKTTNMPIWLDNDANTFAIAEHRLGKGKMYDDVVCLTLGTGVGGGIISEGKLIHGEWGGAGELGHMTINMDGPDCNCGSKGCLEAYASGSGMARIMRDHLTQMKMEDLPEHVFFYQAQPEELTSKEVFQWYDEGFAPAVSVIHTAARALSYSIINFIHIFNPSVIILGGGLVHHWTGLEEEIRKYMKGVGMQSLVKPVEVLLSDMGSDSGLIGAALQVWEE